MDSSDLDDRLDRMEEFLGTPGLREVADAVTRQTEKSMRSAIRAGHDPATFTPWTPRVSGQTWPALDHTGTLLGLLGFKSKALKVRAFAKAVLTGDAPLEHPSGKVTTYRNLAFVHFYGAPSRGLPARRFFFDKHGDAPSFIVSAAKRAAERTARRAARG
jgi:hypothetical protein